MNSKEKGNFWETKWAEWLKKNGIRAWKDGASGGGTREKTDVCNDIDFSFQVKAGTGLNLKEAWKQADKDASMVHDKPCVVVHFDGMRDDEFLVVMNNYDWLDLVMGENEVKNVYQDPRAKYAVQRMIDAAKQALKHFDI